MVLQMTEGMLRAIVQEELRDFARKDLARMLAEFRAQLKEDLDGAGGARRAPLKAPSKDADARPSIIGARVPPPPPAVIPARMYNPDDAPGADQASGHGFAPDWGKDPSPEPMDGGRSGLGAGGRFRCQSPSPRGGGARRSPRPGGPRNDAGGGARGGGDGRFGDRRFGAGGYGGYDGRGPGGAGPGAAGRGPPRQDSRPRDRPAGGGASNRADSALSDHSPAPRHRSRSRREPSRSRSQEGPLTVKMPYLNTQPTGEQFYAEVTERMNGGEMVWQAIIDIPHGGVNHAGRQRQFTVRGPPRRTRERANEDAEELTKVSPEGPMAVRTLANQLHKAGGS